MHLEVKERNGNSVFFLIGLGVLFLYVTKLVGALFILFVFVIWLTRNTKNYYVKSLRMLLFSASVGLGALAFLFLYLAWSGDLVCGKSVSPIMSILLDFDDFYSKYLSWSIGIWLTVVATVFCAGKVFPKLNLVTRFLTAKSFLSKMFLALTAFLHFSAFTFVPTSKFYESANDVILREIDTLNELESELFSEYFSAVSLLEVSKAYTIVDICSLINELHKVSHINHASSQNLYTEFIVQVSDPELKELLSGASADSDTIPRAIFHKLYNSEEWYVTYGSNIYDRYLAQKYYIRVPSRTSFPTESFTQESVSNHTLERIRGKDDFDRLNRLKTERREKNEEAERGTDEIVELLRATIAEALGGLTPEISTGLEQYLRALIKYLAKGIFDQFVGTLEKDNFAKQKSGSLATILRSGFSSDKVLTEILTAHLLSDHAKRDQSLTRATIYENIRHRFKVQYAEFQLNKGQWTNKERAFQIWKKDIERRAALQVKQNKLHQREIYRTIGRNMRRGK